MIKFKKILTGCTLGLCLLFVLILPFMLSQAYNTPETNQWLTSNFCQNDILQYASSVLSMIASVLLGYVTLKQSSNMAKENMLKENKIFIYIHQKSDVTFIRSMGYELVINLNIISNAIPTRAIVEKLSINGGKFYKENLLGLVNIIDNNKMEFKIPFLPYDLFSEEEIDTYNNEIIAQERIQKKVMFITICVDLYHGDVVTPIFITMTLVPKRKFIIKDENSNIYLRYKVKEVQCCHNKAYFNKIV